MFVVFDFVPRRKGDDDDDGRDGDGDGDGRKQGKRERQCFEYVCIWKTQKTKAELNIYIRIFNIIIICYLFDLVIY